MHIPDIQCTGDNTLEACAIVSQRLGISLPEAYRQWPQMMRLSRGIRDYEGSGFCELPFCHTLEGEALGGIIDYGDDGYGPRAKAYSCTTARELLALPPMDLRSGRVAQVLEACARMRAEGDEVMLMVSGPFNILNVLMDPVHLYRILRKRPEDMQAIYDRLRGEILRLLAAARGAGVRMISYSDSGGGVSILGPKLAAAVAEQFTYPLMQQVEEAWGSEMLTHLCPKTALSLVGTGRARWDAVRLRPPAPYGDACAALIGRAAFVGQMCIRKKGAMPEEDTIKILRLL